MISACFTPAFTLLAPPLLAWFLRKKSAQFRRAGGFWLVLMMWGVAMVPLCWSLSEFAIYAAALRPYSMEIVADAGTAVPDRVPYAAEINQAARRRGLDPALLAGLVAVESNFDPHAVSPVGAMGLAQIMPGTAVDLGLAVPFDPAANVDAGARYLVWLLERYGRLDLALAAYNAGPGRVDACGCVPGNGGYVAAVQAAYGRYQVLALVPAGARVTSMPPAVQPFKGVDYTLGCGSLVLSPVAGMVTAVGFDGYVGEYGANNSYLVVDDGAREVILLHGRYTAVQGQRVRVGDVLGYEASVGNSTGCHTDISIRSR